MKKRIAGILTAALIGTTVMGTVVMAAPSGAIDVISREDGSGTRGAFVELFGIEEEKDGEKVDMTTQEASITNNTDVMLTTVAGDENSIGYVSLGSLNDTVKAVKIDGAEATAENVADDTYKVARPFNIVTGDKLSDAAQSRSYGIFFRRTCNGEACGGISENKQKHHSRSSGQRLHNRNQQRNRGCM